MAVEVHYNGMPVREVFKRYYDTLKTINQDRLFRSDYGPISRISSKPAFDKFVKTIQSIAANMAFVRDESLLKIIQHLAPLIDGLSRLELQSEKDYASNGFSITSRIDRFFLDSYEELSKAVGLISFLDKLNPQDYINEINAVNESVQNVESRINERLSNFEARFQPVAQTNEFEKQKEQFTTAAEYHKAQADRWLYLSIIPIVLTTALIVFIIACPLLSTKISDSAEAMNKKVEDSGLLTLKFYMLKHLMVRVVGLSTGIYLISFCLKNFNSSKHNYVVNLQRANSINGAMWLIDSVSEPTGDKIILQSTNAIFAHQPSGYNSKDPENLNETVTKVMGLENS